MKEQEVKQGITNIKYVNCTFIINKEPENKSSLLKRAGVTVVPIIAICKDQLRWLLKLGYEQIKEIWEHFF